MTFLWVFRSSKIWTLLLGHGSKPTIPFFGGMNIHQSQLGCEQKGCQGFDPAKHGDLMVFSIGQVTTGKERAEVDVAHFSKAGTGSGVRLEGG